MQRSAPLKGGTQPVRRTPLESRTPIRQMSEKRAAKLAAAGKPVRSTLTARYRPAVPADVRAALIGRADIDGIAWCEIALDGCLGVGTDPAHRITTKSGGRHGEARVEHDRLSGVLWACRHCHRATQGNHEVHGADGNGFVLREHHIPTQQSVLYRGVPSWLTDDGRVLAYEEAA